MEFSDVWKIRFKKVAQIDDKLLDQEARAEQFSLGLERAQGKKPSCTFCGGKGSFPDPQYPDSYPTKSIACPKCNLRTTT